MIVKSTIDDIKAIMQIIEEIKKEMKSYNHSQWDENYPQQKDFTRDIENGELYIDVENQIIRGFICVNDVSPEEYNDLTWTSNENYMVIHRMGVNLANRKQGVASKLMHFAESFALKNGNTYMRTDTYSLNTNMQNLLEKLNYQFTGEINQGGKEYSFYCYEKQLK